MEILGDIISPAADVDEWEVLRDGSSCSTLLSGFGPSRRELASPMNELWVHRSVFGKPCNCKQEAGSFAFRLIRLADQIYHGDLRIRSHT